MARREPQPTTALEVSVRFEPSHVAPAWVAQAEERVVPITRRAAPTVQPQSHAGRERLTHRVGGAHACGRDRRPLGLHASRRHDQPRRTPSRARWPPGGNASGETGCTGPTHGHALTKGAAARRWSGQPWSGGARRWPSGRWTASRGPRRIGWRARMPIRGGGSMRGSGPAARGCACTGRGGPRRQTSGGGRGRGGWRRTRVPSVGNATGAARGRRHPRARSMSWSPRRLGSATVPRTTAVGQRARRGWPQQRRSYARCARGSATRA
jgi:hypothetical protein